MAKRSATPLESLEIIQSTLANVRRHLFYSSGPVYRAWAFVWFVGFTLTFFAEAKPWNINVPGEALGFVWAALMGGGGLYTFLFYRRHPVDAEYRRRFALTWLMAFTLMALTVWSRTAAGLSMNAVDFAVLAVHTLSVIYLVTGAVLLDGLQVGVGLWLGASNVAALQLGFPEYTLAMGWLLGIGLMVASFIEDRRRKRRAGDDDD